MRQAIAHLYSPGGQRWKTTQVLGVGSFELLNHSEFRSEKRCLNRVQQFLGSDAIENLSKFVRDFASPLKTDPE